MGVHLWGYHIVKHGVEARDKGALEDPGEALEVTHVVTPSKGSNEDKNHC